MSDRVSRAWLLPPLGALLAALLCSCSHAERPPISGASPRLTFAQLTDPHIFDAGKSREGKPPDQDELQDTLNTFDWALNELAQRTDLDFVVITGDFGLEMVSPFFEEQSARIVANKLERLPVKAILVVPGNNDLLDEDFRDIHRYLRFVDRLGHLLDTHGKRVVDLIHGPHRANGVLVLGLESATFKNSKCKSSPDGCAGAYAYQLSKMEAVRDELSHNEKSEPVVIFTHIPDLHDPFTFEESWSLRKDARNLWDTSIAKNGALKAVFAGHFHSADETSYGEPRHLDPWYNASNVEPRFIVCPPLASKFQKPGHRVQGLLIGTVDAQGTVTFEIQTKK